jgi:hypothetical protein
VVSAARVLDADVELPMELNSWVSRMRESQYDRQPPTGYSEKGSIWVNACALLNRLNFALALASNRGSVAQSNLDSLFGAEASSDPSMVLSKALDIFRAGEAAQSTKDALDQRLSDPQVLEGRSDDPVKHVNEGLIAGLVLGSPEFQWR